MVYIDGVLLLLLLGVLAYVGRQHLHSRPSRRNTDAMPPSSHSRVAYEEAVSTDFEPRSSGPATGHDDGDRYRVKHGASSSGPRWNPYASDQSRASRARARHRAAVERSPHREVPPYYDLLGVDPRASAAEIERAYRKHAASVHPDRYYRDPELAQQAEARLRRLNEAIIVLRDPERRRLYDAGYGW